MTVEKQTVSRTRSCGGPTRGAGGLMDELLTPEIPRHTMNTLRNQEKLPDYCDYYELI